VSICRGLRGVGERTLFEKRKGFVLGAHRGIRKIGNILGLK
jgi:hypothetical protein